MSQYLILIYDEETDNPARNETLMQGHIEFGKAHASAIVGGNALESVRKL